MTDELPPPKVTDAMREAARNQPNTWFYVIDPFFDPNGEVPAYGIVGWYWVDARGVLTEPFNRNPEHRPSPISLGLPQPENRAELLLQCVATGYAEERELAQLLLEAPLLALAQGPGVAVFADESGNSYLPVFTSAAHVPQGGESTRIDGRVLASMSAQVDVHLNPGSTVSTVIPRGTLSDAGAPGSAPQPVSDGGGTDQGSSANRPDEAGEPTFVGTPLVGQHDHTLCFAGGQLCMLTPVTGAVQSDGSLLVEAPDGQAMRVPDPGGRILVGDTGQQISWLPRHPGADRKQAVALGLAATPGAPSRRISADQVRDVFVNFHGPLGELWPTFPGPAAYGELAEPAVRSDPSAALAATLEGNAPDGWQQIQLDVQALGTRIELSATVRFEGTERRWIPAREVVDQLLRLRFCSRTREHGTWTTATIVLARGGELAVSTGHDEPVWKYDDRDPVPEGVPPEIMEASFKDHDDGHLREYYEELKHFPRDRAAMPAWLLDKAWEYHSRLTKRERTRENRVSDQYLYGIRAAETFDGRGDDGRPIVYRPALTQVEKQQVLEYLRGGHLVISAYSTSEDWVDPTRPATVPHVWLTDGPWVWPEAITYYLEEHNISPPHDFLDHIRAAGYRPPRVLPDAARERAQNSLSGGNPYAALPHQTATEQVIHWTRWLIAGLRITKDSYSFQSSKEGAWCMAEGQDGWWSVFRQQDRKRTEEVRFHKIHDAAAQLLGRLSQDQEHIKRPPEEPMEDFEFLIQPMAGEPPLTTYDTKQPVVIQAGTELDRYGEPEGNTVFLAGTAPANRGIKPDHPAAPYHRYRTTSPFEAIAAHLRPTPEHGLPGGGQAYILPRSTHDLVTGGWLIEQ